MFMRIIKDITNIEGGKNMSIQEMNRKMAEWRASMDAHALEPQQRKVMEESMDAMALQFRSNQPPSAEAFESELHRLEMMWAADHPLLATIITETLRRLSAMGI